MRTSLVALFLFVCLAANAQQEARSVKAKNGETIGFYEFTPDGYRKNGNEKYPVIIFLHGIGERGNGKSDLRKVLNVGIPKYIQKGHKMRFEWNGKSESFIVLSPQLNSRYGVWQNFYVEEMIKYAKKNLNIDKDRIFLTGLSLGGGGVWDFASETLNNAKQLAAIVPICGTCRMSNGGNIARADLPVWAFHATNDGRVTVGCTKSAISNIKKNNPTVEPNVTLWPTGNHGIWDRVYDPESEWSNPNMYEWLLGQSRKLRVNKKPVADAGPDVTVAVSEDPSLNGSRSYDSDGRIVRQVWKKISGPSSGIISNVIGTVTMLTGLKTPGKYRYELTVVDDRADWSTDTIQVTVTNKTESNKKPVADAGDDISTTLPDNSVFVNGGSSKDPDGSIKKYKWTKTSGPNKYEIVNDDAVSTAIKNLAEGTYVFRLTITDNDNSSAYDELKVVVNEASNKAPKANAGSNSNLWLPDDKVNLNGGDSKDEDGKIVRYQWTKVSGPQSYHFVNANASFTQVRDLKEGTYTFRLTVTDDKKASDHDDVVIKVNAEQKKNQAPVAKAGNNVSIKLPDNSVRLDGSDSKDADGDIVAYSWQKISGPGNVDIVNEHKAITEVKNLKEGTYKFRLVVKDNDNETSYDDVTVEVFKKHNNAPVANAGYDMKATLPDNSVTVYGFLSKDSDGKIVAYRWKKISGPAAGKIRYYNNASTEIRDLAEGTYIFRLTVTDNDGATSYDDAVVTVLPAPNKAPVASAGSNSLVNLPENTAQLSGTRSHDADGKIVSAVWRKISGPNSYRIAKYNQLETEVSNLVRGEYVFELTVRDNDNAVSSDRVTITVNTPPIARVGFDYKMLVLPQNDVFLNGSGSADPDGKIVSYSWKKISGPDMHLIAAPRMPYTKIDYLQPGEYVFRFEVKDDKNATAHRDIKVIVAAAKTNAPNSSVITDVADEEIVNKNNPGKFNIAQDQLTLSPNPARASLRVELTSSASGASTINIYDVSGRAVKKQAFEKPNASVQRQLDVSDLKPGMYHVEVIIAGSKKLLSRFIKQ
jgi:predicted esterase